MALFSSAFFANIEKLGLTLNFFSSLLVAKVTNLRGGALANFQRQGGKAHD